MSTDRVLPVAVSFSLQPGERPTVSLTYELADQPVTSRLAMERMRADAFGVELKHEDSK